MSASGELRIRGVRACGLDLASARPAETAAGVMRTTPLVLIDLATEEGITGRSYLRCYTSVALQPLAQLVTNLAALVTGDPADPAGVQNKLQQHVCLLGPQGLTGMAIAGIDMALWDACAQAAGVPLVTLLGGHRKPIPAYASLRAMDPKRAAAEAEELLTLGFAAIKVKVGRGDLAADLETLRAVRHAIGGGIDLLVDYNQSLTVNEALDRVRVLDHEGLFWIEEPTRADDYQGHARIAAAAETPIQLGENWWGPHDMANSIAAGASDHVTLDVMKLGGVTGWLHAAALAQTAGLPASSHTFPELSVHLLAITPTCHRLEYLDHAGPILQEPIRSRRVMRWHPSGPGAACSGTPGRSGPAPATPPQNTGQDACSQPRARPRPEWPSGELSHGEHRPSSPISRSTVQQATPIPPGAAAARVGVAEDCDVRPVLGLFGNNCMQCIHRLGWRHAN